MLAMGESNTPSKHRSMEQLMKSPQVQEVLKDTLRAVMKKDHTPINQARYMESSSSPSHKSSGLFPKIEKFANIHVLKQIHNLKKKKHNSSPQHIKKSSQYHKKYQLQQGKFMQILHQPIEALTTLNITSKPIHVISRPKNQESFLNSSMDMKPDKDIIQKIRRQIEKQNTQQEDVIRAIKPAPRQNSQVIKTARMKEPLAPIVPLQTKKKKVRRFDGIYFIDPKYPQDPIFQEKYAGMRHYFNILNLSNNLFVQPTLNSYKAYIGKGNNGMLVRQVLKTRWWWTILEEQEQCSFVWTQLKVNTLHESMKSLIKNANESLSSQSASSSLTTVGSIFIQKDDQSDSEMQSSKKIQNQWGKFLTSNDIRQFCTIFNGQGRQSKLLTLEQAQNIRSRLTNYTELPKMHNHLENNFHLGNKKALFYNMRAYYEAQNQNVFDSLPVTYHIKSPDSSEYKQFIDSYQNRQTLMQGLDGDENKKIRNIWIIKPGEITNRGNGIKVSEDLGEIQQILNSKEMHKNGSYKTFIVQLYIDRPLLYNKRKFDIRCYSLYSSINGYQKGYWYTEGYVRTSCKEFSMKNLTNKMIHLTNDAVQKKSEDYGKFEKGNKVSFDEFTTYVENLGGDFSKIYARMKQMATEQFKGVYGKMDPNKRENTFEIFGLDFMIDDQFKVYMIEANTNPSIEICCPLLSKLIPQMLDNAFKIVLDPIYPPPNFYNPKKLICENYTENKFELVFDENVDASQLVSTPNYDIGLIEEESEDEEPE